MSALHRDPEALLAHAGWMRALALALVRNPDDADDLVQDAQLAALLRPPPPEASARAWLAVVVRNLAGKSRRARVHRAEREERAAPPAGEPAPADTLERLDLQRALLDAVRGLDEPFRATLVGRYFEGCSSAEIARRAGVTAGTVRWRLKRGLELLRARLDAGHPRATWVALLAPLGRIELSVPLALSSPPVTGAAAASTVLLPGALTVSLLKLGVPLALVSIVGFAWWQLADAPAREPLQVRAEPARDAVLASPTQPRPVAAGAERTAPASVAAAAASEPSIAPAVATLPAASTGRVAARFVDAQGVPWADVAFQALRFRRESEPLTVGPVAMSGADGRAELEVDFPGWADAEWRFDFLARRPELAQKKLGAVLRMGELVQLGDVVLGPGARVSGHVHDVDGLAVAGARVGAAPASDVELADEASRAKVARLGCAAFDADLSVATAADGSFVLEGAQPGAMLVWAHAAGRRYGWSEPLELHPGGELAGVELVLAPLASTDRIAGQVFDPVGEPCQASIFYIERIGARGSGRSISTDDDGRFELLVSDAGAVFELTAHASVASGLPPVTVRDVRPGDLEVEIRLAEARELLLDVHDPEGNPLAGVVVTIHLTRMASETEIAAAGPGEYRVPCPGGEFQLEVEAPGHRPAREGPLGSGALPARLDIVLERTPRVRGRVIAGGVPVASARVELRYWDEGGGMTVNGLRCVSSPFVDSEATSDGEGRFELELVRDEPFLVRASHADWAVGESEPYAASAAAQAEPLAVEVVLTAGGTLEGLVRVPVGERPDGRFVVAHHGDGVPRCVRTDRDGRYRFDRLAPGSWQVLVRDEELDPNSTSYGGYRGDAPLEWSCTVEPGRTTRFDLEVP